VRPLFHARPGSNFISARPRPRRSPPAIGNPTVHLRRLDGAASWRSRQLHHGVFSPTNGRHREGLGPLPADHAGGARSLSMCQMISSSSRSLRKARSRRSHATPRAGAFGKKSRSGILAGGYPVTLARLAGDGYKYSRSEMRYRAGALLDIGALRQLSNGQTTVRRSQWAAHHSGGKADLLRGRRISRTRTGVTQRPFLTMCRTARSRSTSAMAS